jgi:hypothetical protein
MLSLGLLGIWAVIRFIHNFFERRKKRVPVFTLAMASQIMLVVAIVLRMIHQSFQTEGRLLNYTEAQSQRMRILVLAIINNATTGLLLAATSLIIGFWFNIAISKMHLRAAKVIRVVSIVSTVIVCSIYTVGFVLIVISQQVTPITTAIIVTPLVVTVVGYFITAIYLFVVTKSTAPAKLPLTKDSAVVQQMFVRKAVLMLAVFWVVAIISGAAGGSMLNMVGTSTVAYIPMWLFQCFEICIIVIVQIMLSRKRTPWTLIHEIITNSDFGGGIRISTQGVSDAKFSGSSVTTRHSNDTDSTISQSNSSDHQQTAPPTSKPDNTNMAAPVEQHPQ